MARLKRILRWCAWIFAGLTVLSLTLIALVWFNRMALIEWAVESDSGRGFLSRQVSKAIKVEGEFAPIEFDDWRIRTDSFTSQGRPGEAIERLDAYGVRTEFVPDGLTRKLWEFDNIDIERGFFRLRMPDDSKKIKEIKGPPPPWAPLLPDRFEPHLIRCPSAVVEFPFRDKSAVLTNLALVAWLQGRDFHYYATNGMLEMALLPRLNIDRLHIYVTRPAIDIYEAELSGIPPYEDARVSLSGHMGMRDDKSLIAAVRTEQLPFTDVLPERLHDKVTGKISGSIYWTNGPSGKDARAFGQVHLIDTRLRDVPFLRGLHRFHRNDDLLDISFNRAFALTGFQDDAFSISNLVLRSADAGLRVEGGLRLHTNRFLAASAEVVLDRVQEWVPPAFRTNLNGELVATLDFLGDPSGDDARAKGWFWAGATELDAVPTIKRFADKFQLDGLRTITFDTAQGTFFWTSNTLRASGVTLAEENKFHLTGEGWMHTGDILAAQLWLRDIQLEHWVSEALRKRLSGTAGASAHIQMDPDGKHVQIVGDLRIADLTLDRFPPLLKLANQLNLPALRRLAFPNVAASYRWQTNQLLLSAIDLQSVTGFQLEGSAVARPDGHDSADLQFRNLPLQRWAAPLLNAELNGSARGRLQFQADWRDLRDSSAQGSVQMAPLRIAGLSVLAKAARWFKSDSWLELKLTRASADARFDRGTLQLDQINFLAPGQIGLRGRARIASNNALSGTLLLGLNPDDLGWLPNRNALFPTQRDGLIWAEVQLSGTVKKPKENLSSRLLAHLKKHPFALAGIGMRILSWWLGDKLGTAPDYSDEAP